ncbi:MAG: hypothetical protein H6741_07240 [Alphaproteobacteria bacterium]|nr:hypothetical protein [Alphaproteobacteria bacterium]
MSDVIHHALQIDPSDVSLRRTAVGLELGLRDGALVDEPGSPGFPVRALRLALPPGTEASRVTARVLATRRLTSAFTLVAPVPTPETGVSPSEGGPRRRYVPHAPELYQRAYTDGRHQVVQLMGTEWMGDIPVAVLRVRPLRYAEEASVELVTDLELSVHLRPDQRAPSSSSRAARRSLKLHELARHVVRNPRTVERMAHPTRSRSLMLAADPAVDLSVFEAPPPPPPPPTPSVSVPDQVDYLILTDNTRWDAQAITPDPAGPPGDLIAAFSALATWKRDRGLRTHVASVTDIVNGGYGDFRTGARDLQEVLRSFLKDFCDRHGVEWVLLGGDTHIIPARLACGSVIDGAMDSAPKKQQAGAAQKDPDEGEYAWKGDFMALRFNDSVLTDADVPGGDTDHVLTMLSTGRVIPHDSAAAVAPGTLRWTHCTDDTYSTPSATVTQWGRVDGPAAVIQDAPQWYTKYNLIPTDLYYASLYGPRYDQPGRHDWDLLDNGLYAQATPSDANVDGVDYQTDVSVGRAPVRAAVEAQTFVDKVKAYESAPDHPATWDRFDRMLIAASNWGHESVDVSRSVGDPLPPSGWPRYSHDAANDRSIFRSSLMEEHPGVALRAYTGPNVSTHLPYDHSPNGAGAGWYYAVSDVDYSPSVHEIVLFEIAGIEWVVTVPVPTGVVVVHAPAGSALLTPDAYSYDADPGVDAAVTQSEATYSAMLTPFHNVNTRRRLYVDEADLPAQPDIGHLSPGRLYAELNTGTHLFGLTGHGHFGHCGAQLQSGDVAAEMNNGDDTCITFVNSCLTAGFDQDHFLGRAMLTHAGGGAVAYVGFSRYCWVNTSWEMMRDFFTGLASVRHLGVSVDGLRLMGSQDLYHRWHAFGVTLLGCPELQAIRDDLDAAPYWIGNARSYELHERTCPWVKWMWAGNKVRFDSVNQGLSAGYDGCAFCLHEHHHH